MRLFSMRLLTVALVTLLSGVALAVPKLERQQVAGMTIAVPAGWSVKTATKPVPTIIIEERAGAADSPSVLMMSVPLQQGGPTIGQLANRLVATSMKPARKLAAQTSPDGAVMTLWQGPIGGIPAKMVVVSQSNGGYGMVAAFAAPVARFDVLGGPMLLLSVITGQVNVPQPQMPTQAQRQPAQAQRQPAQAQRQPAQARRPAGALQIPRRYAKSPMPVLDYLVDSFDRLSPAQVAMGLRQMTPQGHQMLAIYGAFGSLLHYIGCQADGSLVLPSGENCAQTAASWRSTMQFSNNNFQQATSYAMSQRGELQTATGCRTGRIDKATCRAYLKTKASMNRMQQNTNARINSNMRPNGCLMGDPGCVAY